MATFQRLAVAPADRQRPFRVAAVPETVPIPSAADLPPGAVLCRVEYAGLNASDINFARGLYEQVPGSGSAAGATLKTLYPGFEFCGTVAAVGPPVAGAGAGERTFKPGDAVVCAPSAAGCFAEYVVVENAAKQLSRVPEVSPEMLVLPVSGLTAFCGLHVVGELQKGETVLVTAAAGGTGSVAVQLAVQAGCRVIGTCGSDEKCDFLRSLGCERAINRHKEDFLAVVKKEYPRGVNVVYESVGGETFDKAVSALAVRGRLVVIGSISGYEDGSSFSAAGQKQRVPLPAKLLTKSCSVRGMMMFHYAKHYPRGMKLMTDLWSEKKLRLEVTIVDKPVRDLADAVEMMFKGENKGKLVARIIPEGASKL
jgi:prostaglandin reductase 3